MARKSLTGLFVPVFRLLKKLLGALDFLSSSIDGVGAGRLGIGLSTPPPPPLPPDPAPGDTGTHSPDVGEVGSSPSCTVDSTPGGGGTGSPSASERGSGSLHPESLVDQRPLGASSGVGARRGAPSSDTGLVPSALSHSDAAFAMEAIVGDAGAIDDVVEARFCGDAGSGTFVGDAGGVASCCCCGADGFVSLGGSGGVARPIDVEFARACASSTGGLGACTCTSTGGTGDVGEPIVGDGSVSARCCCPCCAATPDSPLALRTEPTTLVLALAGANSVAGESGYAPGSAGRGESGPCETSFTVLACVSSPSCVALEEEVSTAVSGVRGAGDAVSLRGIGLRFDVDADGAADADADAGEEADADSGTGSALSSLSPFSPVSSNAGVGRAARGLDAVPVSFGGVVGEGSAPSFSSFSFSAAVSSAYGVFGVFGGGGGGGGAASACAKLGSKEEGRISVW